MIGCATRSILGTTSCLLSNFEAIWMISVRDSCLMSKDWGRNYGKAWCNRSTWIRLLRDIVQRLTFSVSSLAYGGHLMSYRNIESLDARFLECWMCQTSKLVLCTHADDSCACWSVVELVSLSPCWLAEYCNCLVLQSSTTNSSRW